MVTLQLASTQPQRESTPQVRQKTFDVVWKTINDKYFDPTFGGIDWNAVRSRYAPQVPSVKSDRELFDLIGRMLAELPISHLNLLELSTLGDQMARSVVTMGVVLRNLADEVVVTRVLDGSPAARAGLRPGFSLRTVDDQRVTDARAAEKTLATGNPTHRVTMADDTNVLREFVLARELPPPDKLESTPLIGSRRYVLIESKRLADGFGYIHFTNFIAPLKKKLLLAVASMKDAPGVIIDLRGNSGGDSEGGMALAGMLVDRPLQLAIERTRKSDDLYYKAKPQASVYIGPVAILIDEESASESEQVTAGLQAHGRVKVVGRKSRGIVMDATAQNLPIDDVALLYPMGQPRTPKGVVLEGNGVTPDIDVGLTRAELLKGNDSQLSAAIDYLRTAAAERNKKATP